MTDYRKKIVEGYRERLLKALLSHDVYSILREIGHPPAEKDNSLDGRYYLPRNWNEDIKARVLETVTRNLEMDITL